MTGPSLYYDPQQIHDLIRQGKHRAVVGGMWDELGELQLNTLIHHGLQPHHKLIDVGCGCLRGGVHFVKYLEPGNYYGIDINDTLLETGYNKELTEEDRKKLPRENLKEVANFDFAAFDETFDYAIALSVFTHLPLNNIRICLERLLQKMNPGSMFLATFFEIEQDARSYDPKTHDPGGITTFGAQDPFHYYLSDFSWAIQGLPWSVKKVPNFNHPRNQQLLCFSKTA